MKPAVGDFACIRTHGWMATVIRVVLGSKWNHAGVYVGPVQWKGQTVDGLVEAQPGGARIVAWDRYGADAAWVHRFNPDPATGAAIGAAAVSMLDTPYGYLDIAAIAFAQHRLGGRVDRRKALKDQPWWVRRIVSMRTAICSQLADAACRIGGVHLFNDGRLEQLVSPWDLADLAGLH